MSRSDLNRRKFLSACGSVATVGAVGWPGKHSALGAATAESPAEAPAIDGDFPGGNVVLERIEGDAVYLHQDQRDTPGFWFYWYFRVRGATGRTPGVATARNDCFPNSESRS